MPAEYCLSVAAQQQLIDIYRYTLNQWGEAQANRYLADLYTRFQSIADGEVRGRLIQPEYGVAGYYTRCGKHFVYWKTLGDGQVGIAEILHEQMNLGDRLTGSSALNQPSE